MTNAQQALKECRNLRSDKVRTLVEIEIIRFRMARTPGCADLADLQALALALDVEGLV